jgi:hypothetical protein
MKQYLVTVPYPFNTRGISKPIKGKTRKTECFLFTCDSQRDARALTAHALGTKYVPDGTKVFYLVGVNDRRSSEKQSNIFTSIKKLFNYAN